MTSLIEAINRFIVQRTVGERRCSVRDVYEFVSKDSMRSKWSGNCQHIDHYTWPIFLKEYVQRREVVVTSTEETGLAARDRLLAFCEACYAEISEDPSKSFHEQTQNFYLRHTTDYLQEFLFFGACTIATEQLPIAHHLFATGLTGATSAELMELVQLPIQKVIQQIQSFLAPNNIVIALRHGTEQRFVHLKSFYSYTEYSLRSHCFHKSVNHVFDSESMQDVDKQTASSAETINGSQETSFFPRQLRCDAGNRVWNPSCFRQTHARHSFVHHLISLHAAFPNVPVASKTTRFFMGQLKSTNGAEVYEKIQPYAGHHRIYKNVCSVRAVHVANPRGEKYTYQLSYLQNTATEPHEETGTDDNTVEVVDINMDSLPINTQVNVTGIVSIPELKNANGDIFPLDKIATPSWLPTERTFVVSHEDENIEAQVVQHSSSFWMKKHRNTLLLSLERSMEENSSVIRVSRINGYRMKIFDRVRLMHEHITRVAFDLLPLDNSGNGIIRIDTAAGDMDAYEEFKRLHFPAKVKAGENLKISMSLQTILDKMPLWVFCAVFKGKWNFSQLLQMQRCRIKPWRDVLVADMYRHALPSGIRNVRLEDVPELQGEAESHQSVYEQFIILLRRLNFLRLIDASTCINYTPQGSSAILYHFPVLVGHPAANDMSNDQVQIALRHMWTGIDAYLEQYFFFRKDFRRTDDDAEYLPSRRPVKRPREVSRRSNPCIAQRRSIQSYLNAQCGAAHTFFTIPWWFNPVYMQTTETEALTLADLHSLLKSALPHIENFFRTGKIHSAQDVRNFFSQIDTPSSSDAQKADEEIPSVLSADPVDSASHRSNLQKHFSDEFTLFTVFINTTHKGQYLWPNIQSALRFQDGNFCRQQVEKFLSRPEIAMSFTYLQSMRHAAMVFFARERICSTELLWSVIRLVTYGILDLFCCGRVRGILTSEDATSKMIPLSTLCEDFEISAFTRLIQTFRTSFSSESDNMDEGNTSTSVDWSGLPPTWDASPGSHQENPAQSLAAIRNLAWYASSYITPKVRTKPRSPHLTDERPSALLTFTQRLLQSTHSTCTAEPVNSAVLNMSEQMRWTTETLTGLKECRFRDLTTNDVDSISNLYKTMALQNGYDDVLRSTSLQPRIDGEGDYNIPEICAIDPPAETRFPRTSFSHMANVDASVQEVLWKNIDECFEALARTGDFEPKEIARPEECPEKRTRESREIADRVKAEIVAYLILKPGAEEMVIYESTCVSDLMNLTRYQRFLEELRNDGVLEVEYYRLRSTRAKHSVVQPLWLRAYSVVV